MKELCMVKVLIRVDCFKSMFTVGNIFNGIVSRGLPVGAELAGIVLNYGQERIEISFRVPAKWCKKMNIQDGGIIDIVLQGPI